MSPDREAIGEPEPGSLDIAGEAEQGETGRIDVLDLAVKRGAGDEIAGRMNDGVEPRHVGLDRPTPRDVARHQHGQQVAVVEDGFAAGQLQGELRAVAAPPGQLAGRRPRRAGCRRLGNQRLDRTADRLGGSVAEAALGGGVEAVDHAVAAGGDHRVDHGVNDGVGAPGHGQQRLGRPLALRDILKKDIPHHLARRAEKGPRRRAQPDIAPGRMPRRRQHPELQLKRGQIAPGFGQRPAVGLAVLRVQARKEQAGVGDQVRSGNAEIIPRPGADELVTDGAIAGHHPAQKYPGDVGRHGHQQALVRSRVAARGKRRGQRGPQPGTTTRLRHQDRSVLCRILQRRHGVLVRLSATPGLRAGCSNGIATNW